MTDTKKAAVLDLDAFRALAPKTAGKFDVGYRINLPTKVSRWGGPAYEDRPGPAFYLLTPNGGGYSGGGGAHAFAELTAGRHYAYLDPLLGKLFRDAGYLASFMSARGLPRMLKDVEAEVAKHLPEELPEMGKAEADRMAAEARKQGRDLIGRAATGLLSAIEQLGDVAGLSRDPASARQAAEAAARELARFLDAKPDDE